MAEAATDLFAPYKTITVSPTTPTIGAEVGGFQIGDHSEEQFQEVHRAFLENQVLIFRDQEMTTAQQMAFGRRFGELHVHPAAPHLEGEPAIFVVHATRDSKVNNGDVWHSDVSCDPEPPLGTMLHLQILPPSGGDTLFSSQYAAFEALSDKMQSFLSGLTALHASEHFYRGRYSDRGVDDTGREYPANTHPVVRTHPETGEQALYVNRAFTTNILGMKDSESRALLNFLFDHCEQPIFQTRVRWEHKTAVFWDNRCVQHLALWDYWPHERKGFRVTIKGDRPFYKAG